MACDSYLPQPAACISPLFRADMVAVRVGQPVIGLASSDATTTDSWCDGTESEPPYHITLSVLRATAQSGDIPVRTAQLVLLFLGICR